MATKVLGYSRHIGLLVSETHWPNESFVLDGTSDAMLVMAKPGKGDCASYRVNSGPTKVGL